MPNCLYPVVDFPFLGFASMGGGKKTLCCPAEFAERPRGWMLDASRPRLGLRCGPAEDTSGDRARGDEGTCVPICQSTCPQELCAEVCDPEEACDPEDTSALFGAMSTCGVPVLPHLLGGARRCGAGLSAPALRTSFASC